MACQSHYFIRGNQVVWSGQLSKRQIKAVFERDLRDLQAMHVAPRSRVRKSWAPQVPPRLSMNGRAPVGARD